MKPLPSIVENNTHNKHCRFKPHLFSACRERERESEIGLLIAVLDAILGRVPASLSLSLLSLIRFSLCFICPQNPEADASDDEIGRHKIKTTKR